MIINFSFNFNFSLQSKLIEHYYHLIAFDGNRIFREKERKNENYFQANNFHFNR